MFPVWERVINTSNVGLSFRPCNIVIDVDTDSLRWFQLVADGMTVTEVAQTYAVSQPGVSRALARLEEQVGTPLLRRSGRLLRLTQAGAAFKRHVDSLVNDLDDGLAAVEQVLDPETGLVSLGFPMSLGTWFVPNVIRDFARVRPRARFALQRTSVGEPGAPSKLLVAGDIDLEITTSRVFHADLEWRRVAIEPLLLCVARDHRLAESTSVDLADVAGEPFIMRRAPSGMRDTVLELCAAAGFTPSIAFEVDDLPTVRGFVGAGLGVAVVPALGRRVPTGLGPVRFVPLTDTGAQRDIGLAWLTERRLLPIAEAFRAFVLGGGRGSRARSAAH
jgi:LysR family transcriptional regulator, transcription activator of glutamate synthase operon